MVGGLEVEKGLAIRRSLSLVPRLVGAVCLNRRDTSFCRRLSRVKLARKNGFRVSCLQDEAELTIRAFAEFEPSSHFEYLLSELICAPIAHRLCLTAPNVRHERRRKGREAAFGTSARWRG